jgi:hypothetical protein
MTMDSFGCLLVFLKIFFNFLLFLKYKEYFIIISISINGTDMPFMKSLKEDPIPSG